MPAASKTVKRRAPVKKVTQKTTKPSTSTKGKRPQSEAQRPRPLAQRVLAQLPPLSTTQRSAYVSSFTDAQCDMWGARTKAANVLAEGNRWVSVAASVLQKKPVPGYSVGRLAWLCELLVSLNDTVDSQQRGDGDHIRGARAIAVAAADTMRRELVNLLNAVAGGRADLRRQVSERNDSSQTPHVLSSTLVGLVQLATAFRRFPVLEVLSEDAGLNGALLSKAYNVAETLNRANEKTFTATRDVDSAETNRVEGRVLREMKVLMTQFQVARELGHSVPQLVPASSIRHVLARSRAEGDFDGAPESTAALHSPGEVLPPPEHAES